MKPAKIIASLLLACLTLNPLLALANACKTPRNVVAFSNGIQNDRIEATTSLLKLKRKMPWLNFDDYLLLYHAEGRTGKAWRSSSYLLDLLEVYVQMANESTRGNPIWQAQAMAAFLGATNPAPQSQSLFDSLVSNLAEASSKLATTHDLVEAEIEVAESIERDVAGLWSHLHAGSNIVLAAHSQGTLFANAALKDVSTKYPQYANQVRLVSAGAAASYVWQTPGSQQPNKYVTSSGDKVIGMLRTAANAANVPAPLPSNATHPGFSLLNGTYQDALGHSFVGIYLDNAFEPGQRFVNLFAEAANIVRHENPGIPLATYDVTVGIAPTGPNVDLNRWYGPFWSTHSSNRMRYTDQFTYTQTTVRAIQKWYCMPDMPLVAGLKGDMVLTLSKASGTPVLISGRYDTSRTSGLLSRIGAGVHHPIDANDYPIATLEIVDTPQGFEARVTPVF